MIRTFGKTLKTVANRLLAFSRENKGSVSVEFAFIMPLLITLWLGTMEISEGIEVNKKVGRAASTIGDLLTQQDKVTEDDIKGILAVGNSQLLPYARSTPKFTIVGVTIDATGTAKVAWSMQKNGSKIDIPLKIGNPYPSLPAKIKLANTFVVMVTCNLEFLPITSWSIEKNKGSGSSSYAAVDMKETYYFRPRLNDGLDCTDCRPNPTL